MGSARSRITRGGVSTAAPGGYLYEGKCETGSPLHSSGAD
jgi:hypothetical protein